MANYQYVVLTGVIVPDTADLLTTVEQEWRDAFGADLIVTPDTPQGVMITAETLARDAVVRNNAALANQINPDIAGGVFLDAIWALTGGERVKATRSTVTASVTGVPSTIIPQGSVATTASGDQFQSLATVVLAPDGTANIPFESVEFGPITANTGELTQIVSAVLGWETVTNAAAAVLGKTEQSDQAVRALRRKTLAIQGTALPEAIVSALYMVPGVQSLVLRENTTNATITIEGITLLPHSIYVSINGGQDDDIAMALLQNKSLGCNWNGTTTVNVLEPVSGQTYPVKFTRATPVPIFITATVRANTALIDPQTAVRNAILAYVNGEQDGEDGWTVGQNVSSFELAGAINRAAPEIYVQKVETRKTGGSLSTAEIAILINEIATTNASSITVTLI